MAQIARASSTVRQLNQRPQEDPDAITGSITPVGADQTFILSSIAALAFLPIVCEVNAEGWYIDPFEKHSERWFSDGRPTNLVRDGEIESHDDPPAAKWTGALARVEHDELPDPTQSDIMSDVADAGFNVGLNPMDGPF